MRLSRSAVRLLAIPLTVLLTGACAADRPPAEQHEPTAPASTNSTDQVNPPVDLPDSPVGRQARWVISQLAHEVGAGPTPGDAADHFAASFLAEVPAGQIAGVFDELRPDQPWKPVKVDAAGNDAVIGLRDGASQPWRMTISVDDAGAISSLLVQPGSMSQQPASSWAEVHERLTDLDGRVSLLAAHIGTDGTCERITGLHPATPRPIASIFKLYVLGAVVDAVEAGEVSWSDQLTVTDDVRSLPSGSLQDEPTGTRVSVSQTAAGMIAISDNTASEMLMHLVGRDAVEAKLAPMGHADPSANKPFLTTREFFTLGWGPENVLDTWRHADETERRAIAAKIPTGPLSVAASDVVEPAWISGVGWLGSARDICAALVSLHNRDRADPDTTMLRTILGHNRGVTIDEATWPYVAYKGGSAPGVLAGSWYGERHDGERYVFVMQAAAADEDALADHSSFFSLAEDAFRLLATEQ